MRYAMYFVGVIVMIAAAIATGEMLTSDEPFEPMLPCTLGILGAGIFGFGLVGSFAPLESSGSCTSDGGDSIESGDGGTD